MTPPPLGRTVHAIRKRTWRHQRRLRLLRRYLFLCAFGPEGCAGRLELAHRFPKRRKSKPDGQPAHRSLDELLREADADPFGFVVACRTHHHSLDGLWWGKE